MSKKFASKWFRVAVEGATSDRRTIKRSWLEQAAKNYNPKTYGARVWLEHLRGLFADSSFRAFGDVTELKTQEVEIAGKTRLALYARIDPTDDLIGMNKSRQKIYTSIEIDESFADTGEAYMVGLAVTDSPASLGTDVLAFAAERPDANPFTSRHFSATSMFSEAIEADLDFEEIASDGVMATLFTKVSELLSFSKDKSAGDDKRFSDIHEAVELLAKNASEQAAQAVSDREQAAATMGRITEMAAQMDAFGGRMAGAEASIALHAQQLDTPPASHKPRPAADGVGVQTDC